MKISKRFIFICTLVLLGAGMALLASWDMQRAVAAPEPEAWIAATSLPEPLGGNSVQCPDQPDIIYQVGGIRPGNATSDALYHYNASQNIWESLADLPIPLRAMGVACYQGHIYVAGGLVNAMNRLYIYDIPTNTWQRGTDLPNNTGGAHLGAWDGKLYLAGGSRLGGLPYTPIARVDVYDIATNTWTPGGGDDMPTPTAYYGGFQRGRYLFVVGGISGDPNNNVDQTQRYDMSANEWVSVPDFTSQRGINALSMSASYLFSQGGDVNGGTYFDPTDLVEALDLSAWPGGTWADLGDPLPQASIYSAGACTEAMAGGEIWAIGGLDSNLEPFSDVYYRPTGEPCFDFYFGDLPRESMELGNHPGDAAHYVLPVINNGTLTDTFDITASGVWSITLPAPIGPLAPGETALLLVDVGVPDGANPGDLDTTVVTVTSQGDPAASDSAVLTTSVTDWQDIDMPIADSFHNIAQCPDDPDVFYIIGGSDDNLVPIDDLRSYDVSTGSWVKLADLPFAGWGGVAGCYQGKLYIGSGTGTLYGFGSFDLTNNTWTWLQSTPRWFYGAATGVWGGKLYVAGGYYADPFVPTNLVDIYDIASNTWSPGPSMLTAVMAGGYAQAGPYLYVVGGISGDWNNNLDTTLRLNMATEAWEAGPTFTSRRSATALAITASHLYAIAGDENGGERMDPTGLVEVLDLSLWPGGAWTDLSQPLPWPLEGNAGACTEALTGGEIWSIGGAYGSWHHPWYEYHTISDAYYLHAEPCVSYGVDLPDPWEGEGEIGHPVTYTLTITNTGVVTDYYTIEVTTTWGAGSPLGGPGGPVGPGESIQNLIVLNVPADVHVGDQGLTEIIATSYSDPTAVDNTLITTTVVGNDVHITPDSLELSGLHGELITYTLTVSNMGTITDTVNLTYTGSTWEVVLPVTSLDLGVGESAEVVIYVIVPDSAWPGDSHQLTLTATSAGNPSANDSATLTTTALWYRTLIPLAHKN